MPRTKKQLITLEEFDAGGVVQGDCKHAETNDLDICASCGKAVYTFDEWRGIRRHVNDPVFVGEVVGNDVLHAEIDGLRQELAEAVDVRKADAVGFEKQIAMLQDQLAIANAAAHMARNMAHGLIGIGTGMGA